MLFCANINKELLLWVNDNVYICVNIKYDNRMDSEPGQTDLGSYWENFVSFCTVTLKYFHQMSAGFLSA